MQNRSLPITPNRMPQHPVLFCIPGRAYGPQLTAGASNHTIIPALFSSTDPDISKFILEFCKKGTTWRSPASLLRDIVYLDERY